MTDTPRTSGSIRVGIGGWDYDPWRGTFYPAGLPKARQLPYAASRLTAIEINATYYRLQKPELFARWAKAVPDGFRFAVKASRFCTNRKALGEAGEAVERFCGQGLSELGDRLGPILWQFMPTKRFEPDEFGSFLDLLPSSAGGLPLRHAVEVRHESFLCPEFVSLARAAGVAVVCADSAEHPRIADVTSDFVYARLQRAREEEPEGYPAEELDRWAGIAREWAGGGSPRDLTYGAPDTAAVQPRQVYMFMINGAKIRAPAAAQSLLTRLRKT